MITNDEARARVQRGATWLDAQWPEWHAHIDTDTLDLSDSCDCVIGQLTGDYNEFADRQWPGKFQTRLFGVIVSCEAPTQEAEDLGFDVPHSNFSKERESDFQRIQDAWIEAIADRRLSTAPNGTNDRVFAPLNRSFCLSVIAR